MPWTFSMTILPTELLASEEPTAPETDDAHEAFESREAAQEAGETALREAFLFPLSEPLGPWTEHDDGAFADAALVDGDMLRLWLLEAE